MGESACISIACTVYIVNKFLDEPRLEVCIAVFESEEEGISPRQEPEVSPYKLKNPKKESHDQRIR